MAGRPPRTGGFPGGAHPGRDEIVRFVFPANRYDGEGFGERDGGALRLFAIHAVIALANSASTNEPCTVDHGKCTRLAREPYDVIVQQLFLLPLTSKCG